MACSAMTLMLGIPADDARPGVSVPWFWGTGLATSEPGNARMSRCPAMAHPMTPGASTVPLTCTSSVI